MIQDKKTILVGAVLILVIALVAFNLERFTGEAVKAKIPPKVYLSASPQIATQENCVVQAGSKVYITVETGSRGIRRNGYIYDSNGNNQIRVASLEFDQNCGGGYCRQNKISWGEYRTATNWKGKYCVSVVEHSTNQMTSKCFTVQ